MSYIQMRVIKGGGVLCHCTRVVQSKTKNGYFSEWKRNQKIFTHYNEKLPSPKSSGWACFKWWTRKTKYTPANNSDIENDNFVPKWELIEKKKHGHSLLLVPNSTPNVHYII